MCGLTPDASGTVEVLAKGTTAMSGHGSQMGADIPLEGDGTQDGLIYFTKPQGMLVSVESSAEQNSTIAIAGPATMNVQQVTTVKSSLTLPP